VDDARRLPAIEVQNPGRALPLDLAPGTHVVRVFATARDGTPRQNPRSHALRVFHVGEPDGSLAAADAEGGPAVFDEISSPALVWASPLRPTSREGATLTILARLGRLARAHGEPPVLRVTIDGQARTIETGTSLPLSALSPGLHEVEVELLEHVAGRWGVDGAYLPVAGPLTRIRRTVELGP
jgi:hypothetical protein